MLTRRRRSARLALGRACEHQEPPRKRHKSGEVPSPRPTWPTSPFDWLPVEILCHVLGFLDPLFDVLPARQTCRRWRRVAPQPHFSRHQSGLHGLVYRRYTEHLLQHHAVNNHTSLLRHYLTDKHITPNFMLAMSHLVPIHTYSLPTLRWLHCTKGLTITADDLADMVGAGAIPLLEWVCHGHGAMVIEARYDPTHLTRRTVIKRVAREAILKRSAVVWGWLWSRRKTPDGSPHRSATRMALDLYMHQAAKLALAGGFFRAVDDILPRLKHLRRLDRPDNIDTASILFRAALKGDDVDCIDRVHALLVERGVRMDDAIILETKAIRHNACMSYVWLYRHLGPHNMHRPRTRVIKELVKRHGSECHPLLETLLDCWPALVHELNLDDEQQRLLGTDCLKKRLVQCELYQLMYVLHDRECCRYTFAEMPAVLQILDDRGVKIRSHHPQHKTLHYLARSVGLREPATWDRHRPFETWK